MSSGKVSFTEIKPEKYWVYAVELWELQGKIAKEKENNNANSNL